MFSCGQEVDKKDAGLEGVNTNIHLHKEMGLKVNEETLIKWRASCSHPLPDCNRSWVFSGFI